MGSPTKKCRKGASQERPATLSRDILPSISQATIGEKKRGQIRSCRQKRTEKKKRANLYGPLLSKGVSSYNKLPDFPVYSPPPLDSSISGFCFQEKEENQGENVFSIFTALRTSGRSSVLSPPSGCKSNVVFN